MRSVLSRALALAAACVPAVLAHGTVTWVAIDGVVYAGPPRGESTLPAGNTPVRQAQSASPITDLTSSDLACGNGAKAPASMVAPAEPGSELRFQWQSGSGGPWPHTVGPIMAYIAECTGTTCDKFDATQARWLKISELGQDASSSQGGWYQASIAQGNSVTVTLPKDLAPGDYLVRHELISLQNAQSPGGAEFYASCTQVRVGGSGSTKLDSSTLVSFPGAYSPTDPGIQLNPYGLTQAYAFPGPSLAADAVQEANPVSPALSGSSGASGAAPTPEPTLSSTSTNGVPAPTASASTPSPQSQGTPAPTVAPDATATVTATVTNTVTVCALRSSSHVVKARAVKAHGEPVRPRHFSRVMAPIRRML